MGDPLAREHMVKANLRLVVNIARGYLGKGFNLEDLIEEGNLGLMRAVEGFDGTMDTRFSTYASYWIKQSIRRAVMNNGKPIRLPAYMVSLLAKWRRATAVLAERLGRAPTHDEVGKALRLSKKKIGIVAKAIRVNNLMPHSENLEENGPALDDVLTDDRNKGAETQLIEADDLDRIFDYLSSLEDREATVLRMRFGLDSYNPMTLREVGENLGLTRERVRQLESQALQKLMHALAETTQDRQLSTRSVYCHGVARSGGRNRTSGKPRRDPFWVARGFFTARGSVQPPTSHVSCSSRARL